MSKDDGIYKVQDLVSSWWIKNEKKELKSGALAYTFVPFPDIETLALVLEGREKADDHKTALFSVKPLKDGVAAKVSKLPVAAMPAHDGESYVAHRGKRRPVLILSMGGPVVPKTIAKGSPAYQRNSCILVAPFYGADHSGRRGGYAPEFLDRIRRAEYPQFIADSLPFDDEDTKNSVLRLDHVFAVGTAESNFEITPFCLSDEGLEVVRDWLRWLVEGDLPSNGVLALAREELMKIEEIQ